MVNRLLIHLYFLILFLNKKTDHLTFVDGEFPKNAPNRQMNRGSNDDNGDDDDDDFEYNTYQKFVVST